MVVETEVKHVDVVDARTLFSGRGTRIRRWYPVGNTVDGLFWLVSPAPAMLPSGRNGRYDWDQRQKSSAGGTYDQDAVFDDCCRLLSFVDGPDFLRRALRAGAGYASGDHQDRIADLRREELRRGRTI